MSLQGAGMNRTGQCSIRTGELFMDMKELKTKINNRLKYGCDIEDYSYLENGSAVTSDGDGIRINLLISTIDKSRMYGGLSTAFNFFFALANECGFDVRIIVTNVPVTQETADSYPDYKIVNSDSSDHKQIFDYTASGGKRPVIHLRKNDIFLATFWTTMYLADSLRKEQKMMYGVDHPAIYLIQDYEPGFYKWSSEYMLAESTYRAGKIIAVINSNELNGYLKTFNYNFMNSYTFTPRLNRGLKEVLINSTEVKRENRIIIYGRPFNGRNCFSLIIAALKEAVARDDKLKSWEFLSIGAEHKNIELVPGVTLVCKGKLSIADYGNLMLGTKAGISLMCSPHPSYPPLEMATFGVKTITNSFMTKDLSTFSPNIISVDDPTIGNLADAVIECCHGEDGVIDRTSGYLDDNDQFTSIVKDIHKVLLDEISKL